MEAPVKPRGHGGRICFPDHGGGDGLPGGWEWSAGGLGWVPSLRPPPSKMCSFTKNEFRFDSKSISFEFSTCGLQVDGKVIKAHIWDTASQERDLPLTNGFSALFSNSSCGFGEIADCAQHKKIHREQIRERSTELMSYVEQMELHTLPSFFLAVPDRELARRYQAQGQLKCTASAMLSLPCGGGAPNPMAHC